MEDRESLGSLICTGSHMNRRVFQPEDPWLSLESTILAGNVTLDEESSSKNDKPDDLSTVTEEQDHSAYPSIELEAIVDDNVLNMNIDAISDDEVFFDCTTSPSLSPVEFYDSLNDQKSPRPRRKGSVTLRFGQFLAVHDCIAALPTQASGSSRNAEIVVVPLSAEASSSVESGQRTGDLLVQIVDDFNDMKDHAQSTPIQEESDSGYFQLPMASDYSKCSSSHRCSKSPAAINQQPAVPPRKKSLGRKSPSYKPLSPVDPCNKENYYRGKYSRAVTDRPRTPNRPCRVILMKQFFESRITSESQQSQLKPTSSIHFKTTLHKSPRVNDLRSSASKEASRKKRSARSRPSSCSEISSTESNTSRATNCSRSKSTSDATFDNNKERLKVQRLNNVAIRRYKLLNQRTTLHANSPKDSTIKKRRSFGLVVSPIKPVREIRKIFSPKSQENKTEIPKIKPKLLKTPRIIYTNEK